ncbi:MAG TPA: N-methyl-D-aspartate receptor NMDAR2C subunit [Ramlibacter sp.]|uniref:HD domain-containing protein n=1 Tax=Ramlibacter sp. TaxID=1917967 RepID=UPI002BB58C91|nr:N-methyl-D-aspartate receptor NMDAR2C subunit [Ramlibacter sp.]HVZ45862.1 N-methyl-D-aspartate receptor NMDAR2C subunit [Ramlibacter sp.]
MSVTFASWQAVWRALDGREADRALFEKLVAAYSERHRHYHTLQHLRECLVLLDESRALAARPHEVELALWFHDAVYDVHAGDNEERSATWAEEAIGPSAAGRRVHDMVIATKHTGAPVDDPDTRLLLDIDLAILGAPPQRFDESDAQIRSEYSYVPLAQFGKRRCTILGGFLGRPRLYATDAFHDRFESQARGNLARAIVRWGREVGLP